MGVKKKVKKLDPPMLESQRRHSCYLQKRANVPILYPFPLFVHCFQDMEKLLFFSFFNVSLFPLHAKKCCFLSSPFLLFTCSGSSYRT